MNEGPLTGGPEQFLSLNLALGVHTGVCEQTHSSVKKTLGEFSLINTKSETGEEFLLLFCRVEARAKGVFFHRHRHPTLPHAPWSDGGAGPAAPPGLQGLPPGDREALASRARCRDLLVVVCLLCCLWLFCVTFALCARSRDLPPFPRPLAAPLSAGRVPCPATPLTRARPCSRAAPPLPEL